jgi:hypothetical protein
MRYTILIALLVVTFVACKKDKFTTVPQIKFKSIKPDVWPGSNLNPNEGPILTIGLTDAEGDFGFQDNKDTSYVYVKNISIAPFKLDSLKFPVLTAIDRKNLNVDVSVNLRSVLAQSNRPRPKVDTLYFEVYVKDFAKNKSNVIKTDKPLFFVFE